MQMMRTKKLETSHWLVVCDGSESAFLPVDYSPTPTTDRLPVSGVGDEETVDIIRHCSFTTGSATTTSSFVTYSKRYVH